MRVVIAKNIYGWIMTGLIGKNGKWFLGFSKAPKEKTKHV